MRFMMIVKSGADIEKGCMPSEQELARMGEYNEELVKAGALLAAEGLHPSARGARVTFSGGKPTVTDGPFAEAKELIGGYFIVEARDREEAIALAAGWPSARFGAIEVRPIDEVLRTDKRYA
jgi:hypothetical protein